MNLGEPAWTALASEELSEYRKPRNPYRPMGLVRMLRWLRGGASTFVCARFVARIASGWTTRPLDLLAAALSRTPKTPEGERRNGQDDHCCPDVEPKPQDVVGVIGAQHLDGTAPGRVEHPVEREDLAPGETEPAVDQH